ncbi:MAG TPA: DUF5676 family membrane protein [Methylomirabilota bacterium]|jgi:hypothetical protein|nr:DUF5676 family membrane protein [Methylomirabilota bacterium]
MLKPIAFATSLAALTAIVYLVFTLLALISPAAFQLVFNAQFFGADVASLLPRVALHPGFLATFVILVAMAWVFGFLWAWLYNVFAGQG